ncbi:MAG: UPF0280 family protein, partial [Paracoccaceae bacterium]
PSASILPCGKRLHLQNGPIDLIVGADGDRMTAFRAARERFDTILDELVSELPLLRARLHPGSPRPAGMIARRMDRATRPFSRLFITRMAAVAGAVADSVLEAMRTAAPLRRAYVNNGGDIALHLEQGQNFAAAMADHRGGVFGRIAIAHSDNVGGIATSGRHGRSFSMGIADSVTVLAQSAANADAAATLIANAVDLPGHPQITRSPARSLSPDSDLGDRPVVTACASLSPVEVGTALQSGQNRARRMLAADRIIAAALHLQGETRLVGPGVFLQKNRRQLHA